MYTSPITTSRWPIWPLMVSQFDSARSCSTPGGGHDPLPFGFQEFLFHPPGRPRRTRSPTMPIALTVQIGVPPRAPSASPSSCTICHRSIALAQRRHHAAEQQFQSPCAGCVPSGSRGSRRITTSAASMNRPPPCSTISPSGPRSSSNERPISCPEARAAGPARPCPAPHRDAGSPAMFAVAVEISSRYISTRSAPRRPRRPPTASPASSR